MSEELYNKAVKAITEMYSDKSDSLSGCLENLQGLRDEVDNMIDAIEADIEAQEGVKD